MPNQFDSKNIPIGLCQCGCGRKTTLAPRTSVRLGYKKGDPAMFIRGHSNRGRKWTKKSTAKILTGENHPMWKGGRKKHAEGYCLIRMPSHPTAGSYGYVMEHVLIAEKALGKYLPKGAIVHHVDEIRGNNHSNNLVLCEDRAYHNLLHMRIRAQKACGNKKWRKCYVCQQYDDPNVMSKGTTNMFHRACVNQRKKERRLANEQR